MGKIWVCTPRCTSHLGEYAAKTEPTGPGGENSIEKWTIECLWNILRVNVAIGRLFVRGEFWRLYRRARNYFRTRGKHRGWGNPTPTIRFCGILTTYSIAFFRVAQRVSDLFFAVKRPFKRCVATTSLMPSKDISSIR